MPHPLSCGHSILQPEWDAGPVVLPPWVTCPGTARGPWWSPVGMEGDTVNLSPALGQLRVGGSYVGVYCQQRQSAPGFTVHIGRAWGSAPGL